MSVFNKVYQIVQQIPKGRVLTYGAISKMMEGRLSAQGVGWALKALPDKPTKEKPFASSNVPWYRVINSNGGISTTQIGTIPSGMQQVLLESEGVEFNDEGHVVALSDIIWRVDDLNIKIRKTTQFREGRRNDSKLASAGSSRPQMTKKPKT